MKSVDVKDLGKIAVVMGGSSGEREVSLMSGSGVLKALQSVGADVVKFDPAEQPLSDLAGIDRAFLILHGKGGDDGVIQGVMEFLKIPYTGSGSCDHGMEHGRRSVLQSTRSGLDDNGCTQFLCSSDDGLNHLHVLCIECADCVMVLLSIKHQFFGSD